VIVIDRINNTPNETQRDQRTYPFGKIHTSKEKPPLRDGKKTDFRAMQKRIEKDWNLSGGCNSNDETLKNGLSL